MKKIKNLKPKRDGIWQVIRAYNSFTVADIQAHVKMHDTSIRIYLWQLEAGGYIAKAKTVGNLGMIQYQLIKDNGVHRPLLNADGTKKKPGANQRMWMCMKVLKMFTYLDVSLTAEVPKESAKTYLRYLDKAGYVFVTKASKNKFSPHTYKFKASNDTGLKAPQIKRDKSVYDQNLHKVMYMPKRGAV